jgi:hypothetical protein
MKGVCGIAPIMAEQARRARAQVEKFVDGLLRSKMDFGRAALLSQSAAHMV